MNALAERFVSSVHRGALNYYLLINEKQIMKILQEYRDYYNSKRTHQRIDQKLLIGYKPQLHRIVQKLLILGGLCNHYIKSAT